MRWLTGVLLVVLAGCGGDPVSLGDPSAWTAHPADGVALELSDDDGALRLDFAFTGGGYAIARREAGFHLPANYLFRFRLRGEAPTNHLEFKLVDDSGENVWWKVTCDVVWPTQWRTFTIKKRQIGFAWGPLGGGEPHHVAAIEFAITTGSGGEGTVWIDGLELVPLPVVTGPPPLPVATASSATTPHPAALALDGDETTWWSADADDDTPELRLNFGRPREYGGLTVVWADGRHVADYVAESSDDGRRWETQLVVTGSNGGLDQLYLPETESEWLRLRLIPGEGDTLPAIAELVVRPLTWSATRETFFMNIAREAPRGLYPRGFLDEPTAWTAVGVDRDSREGLLGADGALEAGPGEFSLEPFLWTDGRLLTWNDVTTTESLAGDYLPIPSVTWLTGTWRLTVTALGTGEPEDSSLLARYRLENRGAARDSATLYLALRPFQVNPPVQFLNIRGGTAPVGSI
ncbi:MAG: discoidin domain-containing protein, partial [bacterium]